MNFKKKAEDRKRLKRLANKFIIKGDITKNNDYCSHALDYCNRELRRLEIKVSEIIRIREAVCDRILKNRELKR